MKNDKSSAANFPLVLQAVLKYLNAKLLFADDISHGMSIISWILTLVSRPPQQSHGNSRKFSTSIDQCAMSQK